MISFRISVVALVLSAQITPAAAQIGRTGPRRQSMVSNMAQMNMQFLAQRSPDGTVGLSLQGKPVWSGTQAEFDKLRGGQKDVGSWNDGINRTASDQGTQSHRQRRQRTNGVSSDPHVNQVTLTQTEQKTIAGIYQTRVGGSTPTSARAMSIGD